MRPCSPCRSSKSENGPELRPNPQAHSSQEKISTTCYIKSKVLPVLPRDCPRDLHQRSSGPSELLLREEHRASKPDSPSHRENLDAQRKEEGVWNRRTNMASHGRVTLAHCLAPLNPSSSAAAGLEYLLHQAVERAERLGRPCNCFTKPSERS